MRTSTKTLLTATLASTTLADDSSPIANIVYSRAADFTLAADLKVGSPAHSLLVQLDTEGRDIVLSSAYEGTSPLLDVNTYTFDSSSSSSYESYTGAWGSDVFGFDGSSESYSDVLFGVTSSDTTESIFGLGFPNTYADNKENFFDALASASLSKTYAIGFYDTPDDAPGVYTDADASTADGLMVFGGVATGLYDKLSTLPLLDASSGTQIAFTLTAVGVQSAGSSGVKTVSDIKHYTFLQTRARLPSMPKQLVENIAVSLGSTDLETDSSGLYLLDCSSEFTIYFNFQGAVVSVPSTEFLTENDDGTCGLAILPTDSDTFALGGGLLTYFYFVVDFDNNEISLGQAKLPGTGADAGVELITGSIPGASQALYYADTWSTDSAEPTLMPSGASSSVSATVSSQTTSDLPVSSSNPVSVSSSITVSSYPSGAVSSNAVSSAMIPYTNSTVSSASPSTATEVPTISGSFSDGHLVWTVSVPAYLGPFSAFSYDAEGSTYTVTSITLNGRDLTHEATINGASFNLDTTDIASPSSGLTFKYYATRDDATNSLSSSGTLAISRANKKRDTIIYQLTYTIDASAAMAAESTPIMPTPMSTSTNVVEMDSTTVVTITSCSEGMCNAVPVTTGVTAVTTTVDGTVTEYTTYCPLSGASSDSQSASIVSPSTTQLLESSTVEKVLTSSSSSVAPAPPTSSEGDVTSTEVVQVTSIVQLSSSSEVPTVSPSIMTFSGAGVSNYGTNFLLILPALLFL